jgi:hypothetical protein
VDVHIPYKESFPIYLNPKAIENPHTLGVSPATGGHMEEPMGMSTNTGYSVWKDKGV